MRVTLQQGEPVLAAPLRLRLTVDETGKVVASAPQGSCGSEALTKRAVDAALQLSFAPALRPAAPGREPEPVAVYLDAEARFEPPVR